MKGIPGLFLFILIPLFSGVCFAQQVLPELVITGEDQFILLPPLEDFREITLRYLPGQQLSLPPFPEREPDFLEYSLLRREFPHPLGLVSLFTFNAGTLPGILGGARLSWHPGDWSFLQETRFQGDWEENWFYADLKASGALPRGTLEMTARGNLALDRMENPSGEFGFSGSGAFFFPSFLLEQEVQARYDRSLAFDLIQKWTYVPDDLVPFQEFRWYREAEDSVWRYTAGSKISLKDSSLYILPGIRVYWDKGPGWDGYGEVIWYPRDPFRFSGQAVSLMLPEPGLWSPREEGREFLFQGEYAPGGENRILVEFYYGKGRFYYPREELFREEEAGAFFAKGEYAFVGGNLNLEFLRGSGQALMAGTGWSFFLEGVPLDGGLFFRWLRGSHPRLREEEAGISSGGMVSFRGMEKFLFTLEGEFLWSLNFNLREYSISAGLEYEIIKE